MLRVIVVTALAAVLSACGPSGKPCVNDLGCVAGEACGADGHCVPATTGGGGGAMGGGSGGGDADSGTGGGGGNVDSGTGGGGGGGIADAGSGGGGGDLDGGDVDAGPVTCNPACPDWQECVGTTCVDRYVGISMTAPARTNATFSVTGTLQLAPGRTSASAPALVISATRDGGAEPASFASQNGDMFAATFPPTEGTWDIIVSWPDAGLSALSTTVVDTTPPELTVTIDPPPTRVVDGGLDQTDPQALGAFRRDERATVHLTWTAADLDPSTLRVGIGDRVFSSDAGTLFDGGLTLAAPLWEPSLQAYRGSFSVSATAADDLGNTGSTDGGALAVTRLRWRRSVTGLRTSDDPLVMDSSGNLFVMRDGPTVESYTAEGVQRWSRAAQLPLMALALGTVRSSDGALLYAREFDGTSSVGEAFPADKPSGAVRSWLASGTRDWALGPAVLSNETSGDEGALLAWVDASSRTVMTWSTVVGTPQTTTRTPAVSVSPVGSLLDFVADGHELYVTGDNRVFGFTVVSSLGYPEERTGTNAYPVISSAFSAFTGRTAVLGSGELLGFGLSSGFFKTWKMLYPTPTSAVTPTSIETMASPVASGSAFWFREEHTISGLNRVGRVCTASTSGGTASCTSDNTDDVKAGFVLGAGGRLYTASMRNAASRVVQSRDPATLAIRWEGPGPQAGLSLTCGPSGKTGVLVGADPSGTVPMIYSIVVDAPGIDSSADWPMSLHDPRASRDAASSLAKFQCP